jgi:hypothetical protein
MGHRLILKNSPKQFIAETTGALAAATISKRRCCSSPARGTSPMLGHGLIAAVAPTAAAIFFSKNYE